MNNDNLTKIGRVTVRNGHILIADPHDMSDGLTYTAVMVALTEGGGQVGETGGFTFTAGQADGKYPVYADINEDGQISSVTIDFDVEPRKELPIVSVENFGALNLLAHHYRILQPLLQEYYYAELDDLVNNGYRTEDGRRYDY